MNNPQEVSKAEEMGKDIHIFPEDDSTTILERATSCCGGHHQTIAGALLRSKYWKEWYEHASKNMLRDVDETLAIDAMSDGHFEEFIQFCIASHSSTTRSETLKEVRKKIEEAKKEISYDNKDKPTMEDEIIALAFESNAEAWFSGFDNGIDKALEILKS